MVTLVHVTVTLVHTVEYSLVSIYVILVHTEPVLPTRNKIFSIMRFLPLNFPSSIGDFLVGGSLIQEYHKNLKVEKFITGNCCALYNTCIKIVSSDKTRRFYMAISPRGNKLILIRIICTCIKNYVTSITTLPVNDLQSQASNMSLMKKSIKLV